MKYFELHFGKFTYRAHFDEDDYECVVDRVKKVIKRLYEIDKEEDEKKHSFNYRCFD